MFVIQSVAFVRVSMLLDLDQSVSLGIMIFYDYERFALFASQFLHIIFVDVSLSISWPNSNSKFTQEF